MINKTVPHLAELNPILIQIKCEYDIPLDYWQQKEVIIQDEMFYEVLSQYQESIRNDGMIMVSK